MSDELEALGAAVEGNLLAKAVDGDSGGQHDPDTTPCKNCKMPVSGRYCSNCGQTLHIHRSFAAFLHDIVHSVLHFEGKFWRTLPLLVWKPGELTRRYVHGERAKFISPMALYLFSIFMMYAVFTFIGSPFSSDSEIESDIAQQSKSLDLEIANLTKQVNSTEESSKKALEDAIIKLKVQQNTLATLQGAEVVPYPNIADQIDQSAESGGNLIDLSGQINTGSKWWDEKISKALKLINANPDLLLYKLKANGYKFAWLLIPISLPFVWITMIGRRGWHFYDHAVFACYSISFMSLLFIFCSLLRVIGVGAGIVGLLMFVYPPIHMFRQLRHSYQLSGIETFIRFVFLLIFSLVCLAIFFSILFTMGSLD